MHKLRLAAHVADDALFLQLHAVFDLNELLGRHGAQADTAAQAVQRAGFPERRGDAHQRRALGGVAAGVDGTGPGVTLGMGGDDEAVQLAEDQHLRAGTAGVQHGVEAGDVPRLGEVVAQVAEHLGKIRVGLPLPIAGLRVFPDIVQGVEDQLTVLIYVGKDRFPHKRPFFLDVVRCIIPRTGENDN